MGIFGGLYPPGCSGTPYDEDYPCPMCGEFEDTCVCPECPVCGAVGDPSCYENHGLAQTQEQIDTLEKNERMWREDNARTWEGYAEEVMEGV